MRDMEPKDPGDYSPMERWLKKSAEPSNKRHYAPWEMQGITELRYWKDRYLEARRESKQATDALTELLPSSAGERIIELEDAVRELTAEIAKLRSGRDFMHEQAMRVNNGWD